MANYDLILGLKPDFSSDEREEVLEKVNKVVGESGGKVEKIKTRGLTELAYPVAGFTEANFVILSLDIAGEKVKTLQKELGVVKGILRAMVICEEEVRGR